MQENNKTLQRRGNKALKTKIKRLKNWGDMYAKKILCINFVFSDGYRCL